jgi:hypothetical protein
LPLTGKQQVLAALLAGGASIGLLLVFISFNVGIGEVPLLSDNQMYFYISERVASGHPPYTSQFDPKNALSMMIWGLTIWIGRLFGVSDLLSARALSLLVIGASVGMTWLVTYRLTGSSRAAVFSALAAFSFPGYLSLASMGCRPKSFVMLFTLLTIFFSVRRKPYELAGEVGKFLAQGKTVYAMGDTHLLAFNHSENWLIHGYAAKTVERYLRDKAGSSVFEITKGGEWPGIIFLSRHKSAGTQKWLTDRYVEITTEQFQRQNIRVFELKIP